MLTKNEVNSLNLSPTKKDFVQIWNELLEVAGKLSERWDPTSTNESDPGIVILKALAGIADKLNYNIDKNTLEAFMPTAAQEDSMRKLCEMLGYNIKYFRSAETDVTIRYYNPDPDAAEEAAMETPGLMIPKFTVITNSDQDITYFTTNDDLPYISSTNSSVTLPCMEGQIIKCESINDNDVITANQITENNRFYLPEVHIAENGIFIYNITNDTKNPEVITNGDSWKKVDNLNIQTRGSKVFKFGFDSYEGRPYLEFPEDYSKLFNDGIFIYYARTNGINGNISARVLTQLELPTFGEWSNVSADSFSVENVFSATTGSNIETIGQAYNNFKKTVGTFETLVTCRDYMNKIYSMAESTGKPYVSNILVTDIRNDLNRAINICSCDDAGIFYKETSLTKPVLKEITTAETDELITQKNLKPFFDSANRCWRLGDENGLELSDKATLFKNAADDFKLYETGEVLTVILDAEGNIRKDLTVTDALGSEYSYFWAIKQNETEYVTNLKSQIIQHFEGGIKETEVIEPLIDHFKLVFYPFKAYNQIKSNVKDLKSIREIYDASFNYSVDKLSDIKLRLKDENTKTLAHSNNIITPEKDDIVSINNYLRLDITVSTNNKVTTEEGDLIIKNIQIALANAFNMRELDFGEEIPFDSIVEVIEKADARIKVASLNNPTLYTTFSVLDSVDRGIPKISEYAVASEWLDEEMGKNLSRLNNTTGSTFNTDKAKDIYNNLAARNILAGRVPLFNYDDTFEASFFESAYHHVECDEEQSPSTFLQTPDADNPYTMFVSDDATYLGYWNDELGEARYSKMVLPVIENLENGTIENNTIKDISGANIMDISTECEVLADSKGHIEDILLERGENIKFRAPNFTTTKTYPAYVNYHLKLNRELLSTAQAAQAETLFDLLNRDRTSWTVDNPNVTWQKVLDYFAQYDTTYKTEYKKTVPLSQKISKFNLAASTGEDLCESVENETGQHVQGSDGKCSYCGVTMMDPVQVGPVVIGLETASEEAEQTNKIAEYLNKGGCIKITNEIVDGQIKANLKWATDESGISPAGDGPDLDIRLDLDNPFITEVAVLNSIQEALNIKINELKSKVNADGRPILPTECDWIIEFTFEYVPFEVSNLNAWETFINEKATDLFNFTPDVEGGVVLWRKFSEGYSIGRNILSDTSKLLELNKHYFNLLPEKPLTGVYIAKYLGKNAEAALIENHEEYTLKQGEYLYIEYTPSTVTDNGTTQQLDAITEIHGVGTTIRPSGFEVGLKDSSADTENTIVKKVTFIVDGKETEIDMCRFGASEQVEIRDLAIVELTKDSFAEGSGKIYIYKNFNDCDELEIADSAATRSYTLKEGEYIYYTDQNQAELAYFTNGTKVTLKGNVKIPKFDIIDIATIFDSGISEIPWKPLILSDEESITFQEFQYVTLGADDTLKALDLVTESDQIISEKDSETGTIRYSLCSQWQPCKYADYYIAGDTENITSLPQITVPGREGNGWEVCSILNLDVSYNKPQVLRNTDKVKSKVNLKSTYAGGAEGSKIELKSETGQLPIAFKTNVSCEAVGNQVTIDELFSNPKDFASFYLKIFNEDAPTIVETGLNKVVPRKKGIINLDSWPGEKLDPKDPSELWYQVKLDEIKANIFDEENTLDRYDKALRLPVVLLKDTYGIFTIYLKYTNDEAINNAETWIELPPGSLVTGTNKHIDIINNRVLDIKFAAKDGESDKILLKPGINCIRVNKTGKLFIKTSNNSQGMLLFDELKLVKNKPVKYNIKKAKLKKSSEEAESIATSTVAEETVNCPYCREKVVVNESNMSLVCPECKTYFSPENTDVDTLTVTCTTQGLNIDQLGYYALSDVENKVMDTSTKLEHKANFVNEAIADLKSYKQSIDSNLNVNYNNLSKYLSKIEKLVDLEKAIAKELVRASKIYKEDDKDRVAKFNYLLTLYQSLSSMLKVESAWIKNLKEQTNLSAAIQPLAQLLKDFTNIENTQHQLLKDLEQFISSTAASTSQLTETDILADFDAILSESPNDQGLTKVFLEVKKFVKDKIEANYFEQVDKFATDVEQISNSDSRNNLIAILNTLQDEGEATNRAQLITLVAQLTESIEIDDITSLSETLTESVLASEYTQLATALIQLRNLLETRDAELLVSEISQAVENSEDEHLKELIQQLKNLLTTDTPEYSALLTNLNNIYEIVQQIIQYDNEINALTAEITDLEAQIANLEDDDPKKVELLNVLEGSDGKGGKRKEKEDTILARNNLIENEMHISIRIDNLNKEIINYFDDQLKLVLDNLSSRLRTTTGEEKVYVRTDNGELFRVEPGKTYTYVYELQSPFRITHVTSTTTADSEGIEFICEKDPDSDEYLTTFFPVLEPAGFSPEVNKNSSSITCLGGIPSSKVSFEKMDTFIKVRFKVTGETGIYNIKTTFSTLTGADADKNRVDLINSQIVNQEYKDDIILNNGYVLDANEASVFAKEALVELQLSEDSQIKDMAGQLAENTKQRADYLKALATQNTFENWQASICKEFFTEALVELWPKYIESRFKLNLNKLAIHIKNALENPLQETTLNNELIEEILSEDFTMPLASLINQEYLFNMLSRVLSLLDQFKQNNYHNIFIQGLINQVIIPEFNPDEDFGLTYGLLSGDELIANNISINDINEFKKTVKVGKTTTETELESEIQVLGEQIIKKREEIAQASSTNKEKLQKELTELELEKADKTARLALIKLPFDSKYSQRYSKIKTIIQALNTLDDEQKLDLEQKQQLLANLISNLEQIYTLDKSLYMIVANLLCPTLLLTSFEDNTEEDKKFFGMLEDRIQSTIDWLASDIQNLEQQAEVWKDSYDKDAILLDLLKKNLTSFKANFKNSYINLNWENFLGITALPEFLIDAISEKSAPLPNIRSCLSTLSTLENLLRADLHTFSADKFDSYATNGDIIIEEILRTLADKIQNLKDFISDFGADPTSSQYIEYKEAFLLLKKENDLLSRLRRMDTNRDFYYTAPTSSAVAIDFNEGSDKLNNLGNPLINYDVNNVNNSFVISKLDIDYLKNGIKIARSSRFN